ncbi:hypothetical protein Mp_1g11010 [Marchantia polymorpha subsp. ruderalis]|uniref:Lariat debranching enzyme C-terminal domain-containing protein n=1 Tax=Marchantia polymorpha subsp. ruderalis TaxID=1480154 RepID=A0AAF6ANV1_MARPO|nr:hypothetical protein Mp_1g11010 [Marchantia polymorpha subsp. ruderalis]
MKIAVEGCAHGDLENIYATLQHLELVQNTKIDLLICCGDFQAIRNEHDMECLACPAKYREIGSFWKYYSGIEKAPYPTIFVGGNHEASNYLWELYYGGWAAPDIYFMGFAGVINFGGVRIGGLSGIYKPKDYRSGHYERAPYNESDMRSIYHIREYDVNKLLQVKDTVDIFISHDWPCGVVNFGDKQGLLRRKAYFQQEVEQNNLGSKPAMQILQKLKPSYWFSAHLHTKFAALVHHQDGSATKFLALDKCLPGRDFLQVLEVPSGDGPFEFKLDEEWLAITRAYHPFLPLTRRPAVYPQDISLESHRLWVKELLSVHGKDSLPEFATTAEPYNPTQGGNERHLHALNRAGHTRNQQTEALIEALELEYTFDGPGGGDTINQYSTVADPDEIPLDDEEDIDAQVENDDEAEAAATAVILPEHEQLKRTKEDVEFSRGRLKLV